MQTPVPTPHTTTTQDAPPAFSSARPHLLFKVEHTRYEFLRTLERRANGEVLMLAERRERHGLAGPVIVKHLRTPNDSIRRHRLAEEVQLAYRLCHPAIAQVHYFKVHQGEPYVIMEHVDGPSLETVLGLMAMRRAPVSTLFALHVAVEMADALHHAHTLTDGAGRPLGVVHRDVSPRNVRVARSGAVKVTHFGVAYSHLVGREETAESLRKGDVAYASPEYLHGRPLTPASDVFSLGLVLVELATGRHLFAEAVETLDVPPPRPPGLCVEEPPSLPLTQMLAVVERYTPADVEQAVAGLPPAVRGVLHRALRKEPSERHASAGELCTALRDCLALEVARAGHPYTRAELALELDRLVTDASAARDQVELLDESLFLSGLEAHELAPPRDTKR